MTDDVGTSASWRSWVLTASTMSDIEYSGGICHLPLIWAILIKGVAINGSTQTLKPISTIFE